MLKLMLSAGIASLLVCGAAYATPSPAPSQLGSSDFVQVRQQGDRSEGNFQRRGGDNWRGREALGFGPGDRYRGWHRYGSRPGDWRGRGCVAVGPMWYCP
jgi:hypothetical protein